MSFRADNLWSAFVRHCGERAPTEDLMAEFARAAAGDSGTSTLFELRVATITAILRTRAACNRHFAARAGGSDGAPKRPANRLRSALTLGHLAKEIVDAHD